jgi:hypothetical protein
MDLTPLLAIARQGIPFTAADGQAFVRLPVPSSGGFYILPVRSPAYRDWFFFRFFNQHESLPSPNAFNTLLNHLEAQANQNEDYQHLAVFRRVGARGPGPFYRQILLDLDDSDRRFVEISPNSWRITAGANALLQTSRSSTSLPQPVLTPAPSAPFHALRSCLNLSGRSDWLRCLAWLLAALRPDGPFPFLILQGPPGSGKTLAAHLLRSLIDPCAAPLSPNPFSPRDLISLARHNWILAFDHVSTLPLPLASALCRLSSGLGAAVRETARAVPEPLLQYVKRPVLLTVTGSWSCPPDLAERALTVNFPALPPALRRSEAALLMEFDQAMPSVLGALCSAVGTALARLPRLPLPEGRCPDALAWTIAAAPSLDATEEELRHAFDPPDPPDPLVESIRALVRPRGRWTGSATQLLNLLKPALSCPTAKDLSSNLRACAPALADIGIDLQFRRAHRGSRIIELRGDALGPKTPQSASPVSPQTPQPVHSKLLPPS